MANERLTDINMTTRDAVMKMSGGNPGAVRVLVSLLENDWHGVPGFFLMLNLDSMNVYGPEIWVLFKDCCGQDMERMEQVLRNWQWGNLTQSTIQKHIAKFQPFDFDKMKTVDELLQSA